MKRIGLLLFGALAIANATGCCCSRLFGSSYAPAPTYAAPPPAYCPPPAATYYQAPVAQPVQTYSAPAATPCCPCQCQPG
ncbi:MAG TPA: hypothetical protein VGJ15_11825 [Pirellulales bacterium]